MSGMNAPMGPQDLVRLQNRGVTGQNIFGRPGLPSGPSSASSQIAMSLAGGLPNLARPETSIGPRLQGLSIFA